MRLLPTSYGPFAVLSLVLKPWFFAREIDGSGLALPVVRLVRPIRNQTLSVGEPFLVTAAAESPNGAIVRVEFRVDGRSVGVDVSAPFELEWTPEEPGQPELVAVATDALGAKSESIPTRVRVVESSEAPRVTRHPAGTTVTNGTPVFLSAEVLGAPPLEVQWEKDGSPLAGQGATVLGITNTAPTDSGRYRLVARNRRGATTSEVALVTVLRPPTSRWSAASSGSWTRAAAIWDGERWARVGARPPNGAVRALAWYRGQLVAAGEFNSADGQTTRGIAFFDGARWRALGAGLGDPVFPYGISLLADGTNLWVGGTFSRAGGRDAKRIARWTGSGWESVGMGFDQGSPTSAPLVQALAIREGELFAGGVFLTAEGNPRTRHVARWNSGRWSAVGPVLGWSDDGVFGLTLQTDRGETLGLEVSEDLVAWRRLATLTNQIGPIRFEDSGSKTSAWRFYRAASP